MSHEKPLETFLLVPILVVDWKNDKKPFYFFDENHVRFFKLKHILGFNNSSIEGRALE